MPTREAILGYGANITNFLATAGAKLKKDRVESIKNNIDTYYSKGRSLFYNGDKEKDPLDIATDLKRGMDAYTSLGYTNEAELLKKHYTEQIERMKSDRTNAYLQNVIKMNTNTVFPEGDIPSGTDFKGFPLRDKGVPSFTHFQTIKDGKIVERLGTFDPSKVGQAGQDPWSFTDYPGVNVNIPSSYGETYKAGTAPEPLKPKLEPMQMMNTKTNKPELIKFDANTGDYIGGDGKVLDSKDYRQLTDNEKKGELIQKKNPPDDATLYDKFLKEQDSKIKTLFGDSDDAVKRINQYLFSTGKQAEEAITILKETYKDSPAALQFIDKMYNMRENKFGERQRFLDEYYK